MSNFRTKLLGLAAVATAFAGVSYGQITAACTSSTSTGGLITGTTYTTAGVPGVNPTLRQESQTELVSDYIGSCNNTGAATTGSITASVSLPVTSKAITFGVGVAGNSDAALTIAQGGAIVSGPYYGTVSTTSISFTGVTIPAGAFTFQISNVRVNATTGGAQQVTESASISLLVGGLNSNVTVPVQNVGYISPTLGATTITPGFAPLSACAGNVLSNAPAAPAATPSFTVNFKELVISAFKTLQQENGSYQAAPPNALGVGVAASGDSIVLTLANVPSSATVYLPQSITVTGTTLALPNTTVASTPTSINTVGGLVAFTPANGSVVATYVVGPAASTGPGTFSAPVYINLPASAPSQTAITALAAYAPVGTVASPSTSVPLFAASTGTAANGPTVNLCQTSLLFPFVTNQLGFDTGIVIANTTTDNLGTGGKSSATPASGTCTLSFYGATAPTPATGVADPLGSTATGTTHAFVLSSVAPGFQGYLIVTCPFLDAHGYGFLAYNLTQNNGAVEGYIAEVLNNRSASNPESVTF